MAKATEATEEDIEVEVDTEEVTKEIINKHQINKVEIMVWNKKGKGIMKIKDSLNRLMGINGIQVKWSATSVLEQVTIQEVVAYRGRGGNPNCWGPGQRGGH